MTLHRPTSFRRSCEEWDEAELLSGDRQSLYIELRDAPGAETREVADGVRIDLDGGGDRRDRRRSSFEQTRPYDSRQALTEFGGCLKGKPGLDGVTA